MILESKYSIGDRVHIDGCNKSSYVITAVLWRGKHIQYEISWISGQSHTAWVEEWRMGKADG